MTLRNLGACWLLVVMLAACGPAATPTPVATPIMTETALSAATQPPSPTAEALPATPTPSEPEPTATEAEAPDTPTAAPTEEFPPTPTAIPTTAPQPTPADINTPTPEQEATRPAGGAPTFIFMPRQGGPGTKVNLTGSNFKPESMVVVRIGLPEPVGQALGSSKVDASGNWSMAVTLPGTIPSGEPITATDVRLVVMGEQNEVLGSEPFSFAPSGQP